MSWAWRTRPDNRDAAACTGFLQSSEAAAILQEDGVVMLARAPR